MPGLSLPSSEMGMIQGTPLLQDMLTKKRAILFMEHLLHAKHFRNMVGSLIPT